MTADEIDALKQLEFHHKRLTTLVIAQSQKLQEQGQRVQQLQAQNESLKQEIEELKRRCQSKDIALGMQDGSAENREQTLSYLTAIIDEVRAAIRQLEQA